MEESQDLQLDSQAFNASIVSWKHTCCVAAASARCSYQRALLLAPWNANIYTDIAISSDIILSWTNYSGLDLNAWYDLFIFHLYD